MLKNIEMRMLDNLHSKFSPFDEGFKISKKDTHELQVETELWLNKIRSMLDQQLI